MRAPPPGRGRGARQGASRGKAPWAGHGARLVQALAAVALAACSGGEAPPEDQTGLFLLAENADAFEQARPGVPITCPQDHGAHPDFRTEWWYLTANLTGEDGREYGAQWTLFRFARDLAGQAPPANPWQDRQLWMAHFAVSWPEGHAGFQRYARGGARGEGEEAVAQAGVTARPFAAWLDDWTLASAGEGWLPMTVAARQGAFAMDLRLSSDRGPVLQGEGGFSQKHAGGGGSHYYSQPWLEAAGTVTVDGEVVSVRGEAWLDREWSSQFLQPDQQGWDWFALHLESGEKLMVYQLRATGGEDYRHGVLFGPDGERRMLDADSIVLEPLRRARVAGRDVPVEWRISLPGIGRAYVVRALRPDQWMDLDFSYWEGPVRVEGTEGEDLGRGYLEMTGYAP